MPETAEPFAIRVRDLVVGFGRHVVIDHLALDVRRGEILGLVGASGGGKSVLMRTIIGLIPRQGGEALASASIRTRIKKMIMEEDKTKPLSDHAISMKLAESNIDIARRTVAKYREQLKILPVKHRRQQK